MNGKNRQYTEEKIYTVNKHEKMLNLTGGQENAN